MQGKLKTESRQHGCSSVLFGFVTSAESYTFLTSFLFSGAQVSYFCNLGKFDIKAMMSFCYKYIELTKVLGKCKVCCRKRKRRSEHIYDIRSRDIGLSASKMLASHSTLSRAYAKVAVA